MPRKTRYAEVLLRYDGEQYDTAVYLRIDALPDGTFVDPPAALYFAAQHNAGLDNALQGAVVRAWGWCNPARVSGAVYYVGAGGEVED